jgi:hypothetical protein
MVVLEIDAQQLAEGPQRLMALLKKLSAAPTQARDKRSSFMISFEKAGIPSLVKDGQAALFLKKAADAVPYLGYFINGDPPMYHLRNISLALSNFQPEGQTVDGFVAAHHRLYNAAAAHCQQVGDLPSALEEIFVVNLVHEVLTRDPKLQARAMRALSPCLQNIDTASPQMRKRMLTEAERIWNRRVADFLSQADFIREFDRTYKRQLQA